MVSQADLRWCRRRLRSTGPEAQLVYSLVSLSLVQAVSGLPQFVVDLVEKCIELLANRPSANASPASTHTPCHSARTASRPPALDVPLLIVRAPLELLTSCTCSASEVDL